MKQFNKFALVSASILMVGTLASCRSNYDLFYYYSKTINGCEVYSDMSLTKRVSKTGTINIEDTYDNYPVVQIDAYTFYHMEKLEEVHLPDYLHSIGQYAFYGCSSLKSLQLPDYLEIIDNCAFRNSGLEEIDIPRNVSYVGIGAFAGAYIEFIRIDEKNATFDSTKDINAIVNKNTQELICGCKNTIIPEYVKSINAYAFHSCRELEEINIPKTVERIDAYAFYGCKMLSEIHLPDSLKYVELNAFEKSGINAIYYPGSYDEFLSVSYGALNGEVITLYTKDGTFELK